MAVPRSPSQEWSVVLRAQDGNKLVLYNAAERQFNLASVGPGAASASTSRMLPPASTHARTTTRCPLCGTRVASAATGNGETGEQANESATPPVIKRALPLLHRAPPDENSYFALLSDSRRGTPTQSGRDTPTTTTGGSSSSDNDRVNEAQLNTGYFATFFRTIEKLGQGSNGTVHLVQHVLNGEPLGLYACKQIAVGDSSPALLSILREVHLLEKLQDPHVVSYHHAWLELGHATAFAPAVPTLFILMSYANGGSLEDFVHSRSSSAAAAAMRADETSRSERIRLMRAERANMGAVHLLRTDEILSLFEDVAEGLAFLHGRNVLHLDLKAANVLLHWEDDESILPTAKLCDFGSSDAASFASSRARTGISGTLEYAAPESFERDARTGKLSPATRARDMWALGLILHLLCFFDLPWKNQTDVPALEQEIINYPGFLAAEAYANPTIRHDLPLDLLALIADLVHRDPSRRPKCDAVLKRIASLRERLVQGGELSSSSFVSSSSLVPSSGLVDTIKPSLQLVPRSLPPATTTTTDDDEHLHRPPPQEKRHHHHHPKNNHGSTSSNHDSRLVGFRRSTATGIWTVRAGRVQLVLPPRSRRQLVVLAVALARFWLAERACLRRYHHAASAVPTLSATNALVLLALVDFVMLDVRVALGTLALVLAIVLAPSSPQTSSLCRL